MLMSAEPTSTAEQVVDLQSFIGNAEKKCVMQLLVEPGETVSAPLFNRRFAETQDPRNTVHYASLNNLAQAVNNSHARVGAFIASPVIRYSEWEARKADDS